LRCDRPAAERRCGSFLVQVGDSSSSGRAGVACGVIGAELRAGSVSSDSTQSSGCACTATGSTRSARMLIATPPDGDHTDRADDGHSFPERQGRGDHPEEWDCHQDQGDLGPQAEHDDRFRPGGERARALASPTACLPGLLFGRTWGHRPFAGGG